MVKCTGSLCTYFHICTFMVEGVLGSTCSSSKTVSRSREVPELGESSPTVKDSPAASSSSSTLKHSINATNELQVYMHMSTLVVSHSNLWIHKYCVYTWLNLPFKVIHVIEGHNDTSSLRRLRIHLAHTSKILTKAEHLNTQNTYTTYNKHWSTCITPVVALKYYEMWQLFYQQTFVPSVLVCITTYLR